MEKNKQNMKLTKQRLKELILEVRQELNEEKINENNNLYPVKTFSVIFQSGNNRFVLVNLWNKDKAKDLVNLLSKYKHEFVESLHKDINFIVGNDVIYVDDNEYEKIKKIQ